MMTRTLKIARIGLVLLSCTGAAWAQGQPQQPSPEALTAGKELIAAAHFADAFKTMLPLIMKGMRTAMLQGRPEIAQDYDAIVSKMADSLMARTGELGDLLAVVYANNFTVEELHQLTAFYRTPVGQKLVQRQPELAQQGMAAGQAFGRAVVQDIQPRILEELRKRGHKI